MLLVDDILLFPVRSILWIFREIGKIAQEELAGESKSITEQLRILYMQLETGRITEAASSRPGRRSCWTGWSHREPHGGRGRTEEPDRRLGESGEAGQEPGDDVGKRETGMSRQMPSFFDKPGLQLLLFGGKGGVGKTTCATAAALRLSALAPERSLAAGFHRSGPLGARQPGGIRAPRQSARCSSWTPSNVWLKFREQNGAHVARDCRRRHLPRR